MVSSEEGSGIGVGVGEHPGGRVPPKDIIYQRGFSLERILTFFP